MTAARIFAGCALALLWLVSLPAVQAREMVSIDRPEVNMRSGPGTGHQAIWRLSEGYPLQVLARRGAWLKVRDFESDEGWVYRALTGKTRYHIVKKEVVNIRSAPTTRSRVLGKTYYGDLLRTLERRKSWVKIRHESGLTGWVSRRLLWGW